MSRKLVNLVLISLLSGSVISNATTWQTSTPGYWNSPGTWTGATIPPYTSSDTFIIDHPVIFDQSLVFNSGAYILINAAGGLCGHRNITANTGVNMLKYGILELDTMRITGGDVLFKAPGDAIFTSYGIVTNNGHFVVNGCSLTVGIWFNCRLPEYNFQVATAVSTVAPETRFSLFPNPNNGRFTLTGKSPRNSAIFEITDMAGRLVYRETLKPDAANAWQLRRSLSNGFYYWQVKDGHKALDKGKLIIKE